MNDTTQPAELPALSDERAAFEAWASTNWDLKGANPVNLIGELFPAWQAGFRAALAASASQQAVQAPAEAHGTEPLPHVIEERNSYASELARCRDAFPIPEPGTALDEPWQMAMSDPLCVADYVAAALANVQPKGMEPVAREVCGRSYVEVRTEAIDWLKKHYPALCEKSGLCERVGGRLYTRSVTPAAKVAPVQPGMVPLTDEQIVRIYERPDLAGTRHASGTEKAIAIARAIEAAHGIKE